MVLLGQFTYNEKKEVWARPLVMRGQFWACTLMFKVYPSSPHKFKYCTTTQVHI